jgi:hypothetical protein
MPKQSLRHPLITAVVIASLALLGWTAAISAQSQGDNAPSVAEAARRAREQKKNSAKPARTLTNDNLPAAPTAEANDATAIAPPAATAQAASPAASDASAAVGVASATPDAAVSDEKAKQKMTADAAELAHLKKELAQWESELDVMQRKAVLDADSYYSKTDFASDKAGKANLDAEARQISDKQLALAALKAKISELEALVGESATPPADKDKPQP